MSESAKETLFTMGELLKHFPMTVHKDGVFFSHGVILEGIIHDDRVKGFTLEVGGLWAKALMSLISFFPGITSHDNLLRRLLDSFRDAVYDLSVQRVYVPYYDGTKFTKEESDAVDVRSVVILSLTLVIIARETGNVITYRVVTKAGKMSTIEPGYVKSGEHIAEFVPYDLSQSERALLGKFDALPPSTTILH